VLSATENPSNIQKTISIIHIFFRYIFFAPRSKDNTDDYYHGFWSNLQLLFIRNRNIITIGVMHGITQQIIRIFLASIFMSGSYYDGRGYYEYNLRVGPPKGHIEYLAKLEYKGSLPLTISPSSGVNFVPVSVTNKSTERWSSNGEKYPVFVSYRFFDDKGKLISSDNPLTPFSKPIEPGESETVKLMVGAPSERGDYYAEVDVVNQNSGSKAISWFRRKGSKTMLIPISVR
jgi:hypothetical protein